MMKHYLMDMVKNNELNEQQREDWANNIWLNPMHGFRADGPQPKWEGNYVSGTWLKWIPSIIGVAEEYHLIMHNDDIGTAPTPFRNIVHADSREEALKEFEHFMYEMPLVLLSMHDGIPQDFKGCEGNVAAWMEWNGIHGLDAESFRQSYIEDGKDEYRCDYLSGVKALKMTGGQCAPSWCPNCLHHGLGNTADGDHIACSECGYVEEVKE